MSINEDSKLLDGEKPMQMFDRIKAKYGEELAITAVNALNLPDLHYDQDGNAWRANPRSAEPKGLDEGSRTDDRIPVRADTSCEPPAEY
jgi:hypothetical protein